MIFYSIYSTHRTYKEWKENPTITTVNTTAYPIEMIDYPAITICSQGASKDVMDVILMKQFEDYLKSQNGISTSKRVKRSLEPIIAYNLTKRLSKEKVSRMKKYGYSDY